MATDVRIGGLQLLPWPIQFIVVTAIVHPYDQCLNSNNKLLDSTRVSIPFSSNDVALLCFNSFQLGITCVGIPFSSNDVALLCFNSFQLGSTL
ncbi:hypothetical protein AB3S75_028418 [Citrus x aurantiifolia]